MTGPAARVAFRTAYDGLLASRTYASTAIDLASDFGATRVQASGPDDAPPVVLFHGYQATSAEWNALAELLSADHRVYAVDMMGDAGHSVPGRRMISTPEDLVAYVDTILDGLSLPSAQLCGHSFGAWIVLTYALAYPSRVDRLTLLDPTMCFGPLLPVYVLHATPSMLKATSDRRLALIRWETRRAVLDQDWLQTTGLAADAFGGAPGVPTKIPGKAALAALDVPALVIIASRSRVHQARGLAQRAAARLPRARVATMAGASHYGLPMTHAAEIAALMRTPTESGR